MSEFEQIIKDLIHFADIYNLEFSYNGSFGFKNGTGFRTSLGENIEIPKRVAVMQWDNPPAFNGNIFQEGKEFNCLFVEGHSVDNLKELLKVTNLMTHDEIKKQLTQYR